MLLHFQEIWQIFHPEKRIIVRNIIWNTKQNKIDVHKFGACFRIVRRYSRPYFWVTSSRNYYSGTNFRSNDQESRKVDNTRLQVIADCKSSKSMVPHSTTKHRYGDSIIYISFRILRARDKSCKTPGTSLTTRTS